MCRDTARQTVLVCTVFVDFAPHAPWPVRLAGVRDEFVERAWSPPAFHWNAAYAPLIGGRDDVAGGTWLAVDTGAPAVAVVLNRPAAVVTDPSATRGDLPLLALRERDLPLAPAELRRYAGFYLLLATPERAVLWGWDGRVLREEPVPPGRHMVVSTGLDDLEHPRVGHFLPRLRALPDVSPTPGLTVRGAWGEWIDMLGGEGIPANDPRALLVDLEVAGHRYGTGSISLVGLGAGAVRYDFLASPGDPEVWQEVLPSTPR